jgi:transcriptional regulator with XRE-family HTH domain
MANTVGALIKEARGKAKLNQEALAGQIEGLSAADLGKAERGEKELSQGVLRQIAKLTGVTQASLVNAAKESTYGPAKKAAAPAKKTVTTAKKTATTAGKNAVELTAAEKKLIELYRAADSDTKKKAVAVLKGEQTDTGDILTSLIGTAMDMFGKK